MAAWKQCHRMAKIFTFWEEGEGDKIHSTAPSSVSFLQNSTENSCQSFAFQQKSLQPPSQIFIFLFALPPSLKPKKLKGFKIFLLKKMSALLCYFA